MRSETTPELFRQLLADKCIQQCHILRAADGFFLVYKSLSDILAEKDILDFLDYSNAR